MRLDEDACWERLRRSDHGVLGTIHPWRGMDLVPVVFVVDASSIVVPIDTVKPKAGPRLQRLVNLEADPRCTLLVDRYDDDWSNLWWVRAHGHTTEVVGGADLVPALGAAFPAYRRPGAVSSVLRVTVTELTGWTAGPRP